ncbi:response regulator [Chitinimonas lacunae]|uniref:PleD family two-component system response regulator n=1 Tax=Chitinimonas lacunae TaxID=1963018 RepID=A0ABV8MSK8_9NEIS
MERSKLLVVDDDAIVLRKLSALLAPHYEVTMASDAETAQQRIEENCPDLLLLDIEMPGSSGYDLCRQLKRDKPTIPVVFISSHDTLDHRLEAYDAGGQDFVLKTIDAAELIAKVGAVLEVDRRRKELAHAKQSAETTALSIMTSLGEVGVAMEALRRCCQANTAKELAEIAIHTSTEWGLDANVQIRGSGVPLSWGRSGPASPLEVSIIEKSMLAGRMFQFRDRLAINYQWASLLVKNMPIQDEDRAGRMRDHLAIVVEGVNARAETLDAQDRTRQRGAAIIKAAQKVEQAISQFEESYRRQRGATNERLFSLINKIESEFVFLGLTEGQERVITDTVRLAVEDTIAMFDRGLNVEASLHSILEELRSVSRM